MGTLWGRSSSLEWDDDGELAQGALAYFYEAGTSTPKAVYSDGAESTAHEHPVEADGARWPGIFIPYGSYKVVLKTAGGTTLFSEDNIPNPEPFDEAFEVDVDAQLVTGDVWFSFKNGTRAGAVRCNARTIGDASSGATERANADTSDLFAFLWNNLADAQAPVSTGRGASAAADFAAHKTITLPDLRSGIPIGVDDMGNTAAGRTAGIVYVNGNATTGGSPGGANAHELTAAELPVITPAGTISQVTGTVAAPTFTGTATTITATGTVAINDPGHPHAFNQPFFASGGGSSTAITGVGTGGTEYSISSNTTGITATFTGNAVAHTPAGTNSAPAFTGSTPTFTGTSFGSGADHTSVQYGVSGTFYIKL